MHGHMDVKYYIFIFVLLLGKIFYHSESRRHN